MSSRQFATICFLIVGLWAVSFFATRSGCNSPVQPGDTLSHTSDTIYLLGKDTVIIKEFHYSKETKTEVPVLTDKDKDSVLQDHYTLREYDSTIEKLGNYRARMKLSLLANHLTGLQLEFENLRPTVINNNTIVAPGRFKLYVGGFLETEAPSTDAGLSFSGIPANQKSIISFDYSLTEKFPDNLRVRYQRLLSFGKKLRPP